MRRLKKKELRASVCYSLVVLLVAYVASWAVFTLGVYLQDYIPVLSHPVASQIYNMLIYTAQLLCPVFYWFVLTGKGFCDIFRVRTEEDLPEDTEKNTVLSILSWFLVAFSLSQIMAIVSDIFSRTVSAFLSELSPIFVLDEEAFALPHYEGICGLILQLVATAVLPAILEELLFRGVFLSQFLKYGKTFAIVMSSFLFASVHGSIQQMMYSFVFGLIFGYIAVKSGSLTAGMIIHFLNNAYGCVADYLQEILDAGLFEDILTVSNFILIFAGLAVVFHKIRFNGIGYSEKCDSDRDEGELKGMEIYSVFLSFPMILYYILIIGETLYTYISYNLGT